jgi:hypothetical protein
MFTTRTINGYRVHRFDAYTDSGEAYALTQCDDRIQDGDVLIVPREGIVGFLFQAWPLAIKGRGHFDYITNREGFLDENPQYADVLAYCEARRTPRV